jgi:hypothetical protein
VNFIIDEKLLEKNRCKGKREEFEGKKQEGITTSGPWEILSDELSCVVSNLFFTLGLVTLNCPCACL